MNFPLSSLLFLLQFLLLGAVPFPNDVPRLQQLGVRGVITLNEPYETLVPSSLYRVIVSLNTLDFDIVLQLIYFFFC